MKTKKTRKAKRRSRNRPRKCEACGFDECRTATHKRISEVEADRRKISIDDRDDVRKWRCCRCTRVRDQVEYLEHSDRPLCRKCKKSTRKCRLCDEDDCEYLNSFDDITFANEDGFYCCVHIGYSEVYQRIASDRGELKPCDTCKKGFNCDLRFMDESTVSDLLKLCETCGKKGFPKTSCDCCSNDCCFLCHIHNTRTSDIPDIWCSKCAENCNSEMGDYWHPHENSEASMHDSQ
jgi:hypothetical protein